MQRKPGGDEKSDDDSPQNDDEHGDDQRVAGGGCVADWFHVPRRRTGLIPTSCRCAAKPCARQLSRARGERSDRACSRRPRADCKDRRERFRLAPGQGIGGTARPIAPGEGRDRRSGRKMRRYAATLLIGRPDLARGNRRLVDFSNRSRCFLTVLGSTPANSATARGLLPSLSALRIKSPLTI